MLELAVGAQVVAARVRRPAEGALEASGEVDVVVVAYVRHDLATQLAAMQIAAAREALKGEPHVPGLRAFVMQYRQFNSIQIVQFISCRFVIYYIIVQYYSIYLCILQLALFDLHIVCFYLFVIIFFCFFVCFFFVFFFWFGLVCSFKRVKKKEEKNNVVVGDSQKQKNHFIIILKLYN